MLTTIGMKVLPLSLLGYAGYEGTAEVLEMGEQMHILVQDYATRLEMQSILKAMIMEEAIDNPPEDFTAFLKKNLKSMGNTQHVDSWGSPYELWEDHDGTLLIVSCGPDKECETEDDLEVALK